MASSTTNTISWSFNGSNRTVNVYIDPDDTTDSWTLIGSVDQTGQGASGTTNFNWDLSGAGTSTTLVGARYRVRLEVQDADRRLKDSLSQSLI